MIHTLASWQRVQETSWIRETSTLNWNASLWQIVWGLLIQGHWVKCHPPGTSGTHQVLASALTDWLARRPLSMQLETQKDSLSHKPVAVENTATLLSCLEHMGFIERRAVRRWKICRRWDIMWHEKVKGNWGSRLRMKGRRERGCKGIVLTDEWRGTRRKEGRRNDRYMFDGIKGVSKVRERHVKAKHWVSRDIQDKEERFLRSQSGVWPQLLIESNGCLARNAGLPQSGFSYLSNRLHWPVSCLGGVTDDNLP